MPDRIVRAGILTSENVNKLTPTAEVFYRRLMNVVDDYGRYDGRAAILRAVLYPLQLPKVSEPDIVRWISETSETGLVRQYMVEGRPYLELVKFGQKIRARSKWPDPPTSADSCQQVPANVSVVVDVDVSGSRTRATRLPKDWVLPETWESWAFAQKPQWDRTFVLQTAERFRDHWISTPKGSKLDWEATWRNWVRNTRDPITSKTTPAANPWDGAK
jgi:hypothetical protein